MEASFPLLFAAMIGFGHAFEADHLVAVGNIVSKRDRLKLAIKDGIYWGLGHTSTIFLIGLLMIVGKSTFLNGYFGYLEAFVGVMLIALGFYRLHVYYKNKGQQKLEQQKYKEKLPHHHGNKIDDDGNHRLAYGVGLIHGLAGSGAMILLVMTEVQGTVNSMVYLAIFGIGSVVGMLVAAGIFSLPFSKKVSENGNFNFGMVLLSSIICIAYGGFVIFENLV